MATAYITFSGLDLPKDHPFIPTIKELFREVIGAHTCDRRSSKTTIHGKYPDWPFEDGFAEEDHLWSATLRETDEAIDQRSSDVLDDVFSTDKSTFISVSTHSGEIASLLRGESSVYLEQMVWKRKLMTEQFSDIESLGWGLDRLSPYWSRQREFLG
jgi:hypothetical protein